MGSSSLVQLSYYLTIVDKVTILEPVDNGIVSQEILSNNIYHRIVHIMKLSTQEYYNMRTALGLKCA